VYSYFHAIPSGGRLLTIAVVLLGMVQIYLSGPRADDRVVCWGYGADGQT
jgi:hypothetical protein